MSEMPVEGAECCILEICCGGEHRIAELTAKIVAAKLPQINEKAARTIAEWLCERYTLVPAGLLNGFIRHYAQMAREYPADPGY